MMKKIIASIICLMLILSSFVNVFAVQPIEEENMEMAQISGVHNVSYPVGTSIEVIRTDLLNGLCIKGVVTGNTYYNGQVTFSVNMDNVQPNVIGTYSVTINAVTTNTSPEQSWTATATVTITDPNQPISHTNTLTPVKVTDTVAVILNKGDDSSAYMDETMFTYRAVKILDLYKIMDGENQAVDADGHPLYQYKLNTDFGNNVNLVALLADNGFKYDPYSGAITKADNSDITSDVTISETDTNLIYNGLNVNDTYASKLAAIIAHSTVGFARDTYTTLQLNSPIELECGYYVIYEQDNRIISNDGTVATKPLLVDIRDTEKVISLYLKDSSVDLVKTIEGGREGDTPENQKQMTIYNGDTVNYKVVTNFPVYENGALNLFNENLPDNRAITVTQTTEEAQEEEQAPDDPRPSILPGNTEPTRGPESAVVTIPYLVFEIQDNLGELNLDSTSIVIKVNDEVVESGMTTTTVHNDETGEDETVTTYSNYRLTVNDHNFTIVFNPAYIIAHQGQSIEVTYNGTLNNISSKLGNSYMNRVGVLYTYNPENPTQTKLLFDETQIMTFGYSLLKLDGANDTALSGIKFNLKDSSNNVLKFSHPTYLSKPENPEDEPETIVDTRMYVVDPNGSITDIETTDMGVTFYGLDAGTYTLVETETLNGYTKLTNNPIITISPYVIPIQNDPGTDPDDPGTETEEPGTGILDPNPVILPGNTEPTRRVGKEDGFNRFNTVNLYRNQTVTTQYADIPVVSGQYTEIAEIEFDINFVHNDETGEDERVETYELKYDRVENNTVTSYNAVAVVRNYKGIVLPGTGSIAAIAISILGATSILGGGAFIAIKRKKED